MRPTNSRTARIAVHDQRDDLVAVIEHLLPRISGRAELIGPYLLVCAFWGLVVYIAIAYAIP